MDISSGVPQDLRRPKDFLTPSTRPPIQVSRLSLSSSGSSPISEIETDHQIVDMSQAGIHNKISQVLGDVANLESSGLIAQAVDQEVLEKEIALKVILTYTYLYELVKVTN